MVAARDLDRCSAAPRRADRPPASAPATAPSSSLPPGPASADRSRRRPRSSQCSALLFLCVRYPLLAWRIGYVALLLLPLLGRNHAIRLPLSIALLLCYWVAGLRHGRAASWAMCLLMLLPVWVLMRGQERPLLATLVLLVIQVALDATIVSRRAGHALAEQIAQSELDEARRAVLEERTRIAREMHDVVAHHMSLIAVQAETARYRLDDLSDGANEEFAALSATARGGAERSPPAARRPPQRQPRRARASTAARRRRDARRRDPARRGQRRALDAGERQRGGLPRGRALRLPHRPGGALERRPARARSVGAGHGRARPGRSPPRRRQRPAGDGRGTLRSKAGRPGHGIAGMRERVAILGGSISAEPNILGGFAVSAVLPLAEAAP